MPPWRLLLGRTVSGLASLRAKGRPVPDWVLGGGTALMIHTGHRLSKDIDAFIDDPQALSFLSPRLGGEEIWQCETFSEAANHLKLVYPEGEIDFIVAPAIAGLPAERRLVPAEGGEPAVEIEIEHPVEIVVKKLFYRGSMLKIRDVFDIAVVASIHGNVLHKNLHHVPHLKRAILDRLSNISEDFCRQELAELDIADEWQPIAETCLDKVREIAKSIPEVGLSMR
ncbi:nucleotidyl transferase AbiEii/AbiGii toxin family protein [Microbacteriaceae bacterium K1510]|nr:nucleotidyl transferase AbiEii/AbiGii toxin family protein [Microbacteriaceae bacterium K1510]